MKTISHSTNLAGLILLASALSISVVGVKAQDFSSKIDRSKTVDLNDAAPHTKSQIIDYLTKMRRIINRYDATMMGMMSGGGQLAPDKIGDASDRTQQLSQDIAAVVPPKDIAGEHNKFAGSMASVQGWLAAGGNSPTAIPAALALAGQVQQSHSAFHTAVLKLIDSYGLSHAMDPFADESAGAKAQAAQGFSDLKNQLTGDMIFGAAGGPAAGIGGALGSGAQGIMKGLSGGGTSGGTAGHSSILGGPTTLGSGGDAGAGGDSAAGGLGGLGGLGALLGGAGGLGGLGALLGGTGGGSQGSAGGGADLGSLLKNIDLNGLLKQLGGGQGATGSGTGSAPSNNGMPAGLDDN